MVRAPCARRADPTVRQIEYGLVIPQAAEESQSGRMRHLCLPLLTGTPASPDRRARHQKAAPGLGDALPLAGLVRGEASRRTRRPCPIRSPKIVSRASCIRTIDCGFDADVRGIDRRGRAAPE